MAVARVAQIEADARQIFPRDHAVERFLEPQAVANALSAYAPLKGRMEVRRHAGAMILEDCYNANPGSMAAAIQTLAASHALVLAPLIAAGGLPAENFGPFATRRFGVPQAA